MHTLRYLVAAVTVLAAVAVVSPAGATCYGDACDEDPYVEPDPNVAVYLPHSGEISPYGGAVALQDGVPTGLTLGGWTTAPHVRVMINGFFVMNVPTQASSTATRPFTILLPLIYPWPADREVCVFALDEPWGPAGTRLGCTTTFTWWL